MGNLSSIIELELLHFTKYKTMPKVLSRDKRSSLVCRSVSGAEQKFYNIDC
jgi:hypothetical protein